MNNNSIKMSNSVESSVGASQQAGSSSNAVKNSSVSLSEKQIRNLCISLSQAESEAEVIDLLKKLGLWDDVSMWRHYGDIPNNIGHIHNQQTEPEASLVEKVMNSIDSMLISYCLINGIDPEGPSAPKTMQEALASYLSIPEGNIACLPDSTLRSLAENIQLIASGEESSPNYTILDRGEGQTAETMPDTLLSLSKSNKSRIPFVQGKFNMGGSGALRFCGENGLQLIITKRHPNIAKDKNDATSDDWAFSLVRKFSPGKNERNSNYRYLAPGGKIMHFSAATLPLAPSKKLIRCAVDIDHGTFIKLFNYKATPGNKTNIVFGMNFRLSSLLTNLALPVRLKETRLKKTNKDGTTSGYSGNTLEGTLQGLNNRIHEDRNSNVATGFPASSTIVVNGDKLDVSIIVFNQTADMKRWRGKEAVIFTVNGQKQAGLPVQFFNRKGIDKAYIKKYLLLIVDCSHMKREAQEELFMASRDRMTEEDLYRSILKSLENLIKKHQGLRQLNEQYRQAEITENLGNSKPLADVMKDLISKSPTLASLLGFGHRLNSPNKVKGSGRATKFKGTKYPSFFTLVKPFPNAKPKPCPINQNFRVQFKTDAENNYFSRPLDQGSITVRLGGNVITESVDFNALLFDGTYTFNGQLPKTTTVGSVHHYEIEITDPTRIKPFKSDFYVEVEKAAKKNPTPGGARRKPASKKKGNSNWTNTQLDIPQPNPVDKADWANKGFTENTALTVLSNGSGGYDYFINTDNIHLLREQKFNKKVDPKVHFARYQVLMTVIGMSCIKIVEDQQKAGETPQRSVEDLVEETTRAASAVTLGVIDYLAGLDASVVASDSD